MAQGHDKGSAIAIAKASMHKKPHRTLSEYLSGK